MPSITHWGRLEPRCRTDQFDAGLRAEVRDPLWLLARQWQFGEFVGDDAGSPVDARMTYGISRVRAVAVADQRPFDPGTDSLEAVVEGEPLPIDLRTRVQAGQQFARLLQRADLDVLPAFLTAAPLRDPTEGAVVDDATRRFLAGVAGRVVDGAVLLDAIGRGEPLHELVPPGTVPQAQQDELATVAAQLADWYERTYGPPPLDSWRSESLQHHFTIGLTGDGTAEPRLHADEYPGGRLDWYDVDLAEEPVLDHWELHSEQFLPTSVRFRGMPSSRWWEFEDPQTDFGAISPAPTDLAAMLLAEFALVYADDWFLTPLPAPAGALVGMAELVITNTFGEGTRIRPARGDGFGLFHLAAGPGRADLLFTAPAAVAALDGRPVEEVVLFRDEMANLAWGVEEWLATDLGEPVSGFDTWQREVRAESPPDDTAGLRYRLMTDVAANWLPFQAVLDPARPRSRALELTPFLREAADGTLVAVEPRGRLLRVAVPPYRLHEEALGRTAQSLTRTFQRVRTPDGGTRLWLSRRRRPRRPPGASGLEWDQLSDPIP